MFFLWEGGYHHHLPSDFDDLSYPSWGGGTHLFLQNDRKGWGCLPKSFSQGIIVLVRHENWYRGRWL